MSSLSLSREIMGLLALAILWVNTLLVAGAALKELRAIQAAKRAFGTGRRGTVVRGAGPGGELAVHAVDQVGRAADSGAIVFADRPARGSIFGGAVRLDDGTEVELSACDPAEVWIAPAVLARAAATDADTEYASAFALAKKARGYARTVTAKLAQGDQVFFGEGCVSAVDPSAWASRSTNLVLGFVLLELGLAAACTRLALTTPVFGSLSTLGGALCLAYFLLVQPAGTALRDAVRAPSRAFVRGQWSPAASPPGQRQLAD